MMYINSLVVFGIGYAASIAFFFARKLESKLRTMIFVMLSIIVLGSPLMLSTDSVILRLTVTLTLAICFGHMLDLHIDPYRKIRMSFKSYMVFCWILRGWSQE